MTVRRPILVGMALRCLLVDDSARFIESARALLERQGVQVDVASTGAEAARRLAEAVPDVVLLDIDLQGESGFEVARRLHADMSFGAPGIILVSTHAEKDFEELIEASPALGFLPKSSLSVGAIRELLRASGLRET
jgi:two-component system nitrate/nitrite response regulator NarL